MAPHRILCCGLGLDRHRAVVMGGAEGSETCSTHVPFPATQQASVTAGFCAYVLLRVDVVLDRCCCTVI